MQVAPAIYDPPKDGLPYLVVNFASEGMSVSTANSKSEARIIASERALKRRREPKNEESKAIPSQLTHKSR